MAKAMRASGAEVAFFHRSGALVEKIAEAGFQPIALEPRISPAQHDRLRAGKATVRLVDSSRSGNEG